MLWIWVPGGTENTHLGFLQRKLRWCLLGEWKSGERAAAAAFMCVNMFIWNPAAPSAWKTYQTKVKANHPYKVVAMCALICNGRSAFRWHESNYQTPTTLPITLSSAPWCDFGSVLPSFTLKSSGEWLVPHLGPHNQNRCVPSSQPNSR